MKIVLEIARGNGGGSTVLWKPDFVWQRSRKVPDTELNHNCMPALSVQSVDEVVLLDPVPMLWSDTSEISSENIMSGEERAFRM